MALQKKFILPPPPNPDDDVNGYSWRDWFRQLRDYLVNKGLILWSQIDFTGSKLSNIQNRPHNILQSIQGGSSLLNEYYHLNNVEYTDLTNGGNTTLHYHAADRNLANATGTLAVSNGGTGQSSFTDGELLIGNSTGNTLTKATLTAGSGISITNGSGSITITASGGGGTTTNADNVKTISNATNASFYLTFVDSDNASGAYEAVYTDASIQYNPDTNVLTVPYISGNGTNNVTIPATTGTIITTGDTGTVTNTMLAGSIANAKLSNSSITINGFPISLGGSVSVGTVTSVTATTPIASTGGTTPVISISQASATTDGYLSSTDWNTFNNKGIGTVTSVSGTSPIVSTGGTTPVISLASGYGDAQNPYASKTANYVLASPNGSSGVPTFRALISDDIPTLPTSKITNLSSGTHTPTLTNVSNVTSSSANVCNYLRVSSVVTVSGSISVTPAAVATLTKVGISLPVSSNFTIDSDCAGTTGNIYNPTISGGSSLPYIHADITNDRAELVFISGNTSAQTIYFTFTYSIK